LDGLSAAFFEVIHADLMLADGAIKVAEVGLDAVETGLDAPNRVSVRCSKLSIRFSSFSVERCESRIPSRTETVGKPAARNNWRFDMALSYSILKPA
jgi:hypothetical protein